MSFFFGASFKSGFDAFAATVVLAVFETFSAAGLDAGFADFAEGPLAGAGLAGAFGAAFAGDFEAVGLACALDGADFGLAPLAGAVFDAFTLVFEVGFFCALFAAGFVAMVSTVSLKKNGGGLAGESKSRFPQDLTSPRNQ